jgi:hypothetical protein
MTRTILHAINHPDHQLSKFVGDLTEKMAVSTIFLTGLCGFDHNLWRQFAGTAPVTLVTASRMHFLQPRICTQNGAKQTEGPEGAVAKSIVLQRLLGVGSIMTN